MDETKSKSSQQYNYITEGFIEELEIQKEVIKFKIRPTCEFSFKNDRIILIEEKKQQSAIMFSIEKQFEYSKDGLNDFVLSFFLNRKCRFYTNNVMLNENHEDASVMTINKIQFLSN